MKALMCVLGKNREREIARGFCRAGLQMDETGLSGLDMQLGRDGYLFVFTVGFVPEVSAVCQKKQIPYLFWLVDREEGNVFLHSGKKSPYDYAFCFERALQEELLRFSMGHVYYLPLAADELRWRDLCAGDPAGDGAAVSYFWEEPKKDYEGVKADKIPGLKDYTKGYLEALLEAQGKLGGCSVLGDGLNAQILADMKKGFPQAGWAEDGGESARSCGAHILADMVTYRERVCLLRKAAETAPLDFYGGWMPEELSAAEGCRYRKYGGTEEERAAVYRNSRINLCLPHRDFQTGVPDQVYEAVAAGGFVLVEERAELPELFHAGEHLDVFSGAEELADKIRFYLADEEERRRIAANGKRLVGELHSYTVRAAAMFGMAFADVLE